MNPSSLLRGVSTLSLFVLGSCASGPDKPSRPPNIVVIFIDDLGYADIGPFGAAHATLALDRLAASGTRFTDFQVPTAVCSASRAALLTGCYHTRVGISGALGPRATHGLASTEVTIAEICKQRDYATACFGKWHLGHHPKFLPLQHGFDEYYGLPYSNDMWPWHPAYADLPPNSAKRKQGYPELPMIDGDRVVDASVSGADQALLTKQYTERAVDFIDRNAGRPFFLYLPHSMVHVPLFASPKFVGKSGRGIFGDVMLEVDWSVGEVVAALERNEIREDTLVIFTSDNGPWLNFGDHAGSAAPLREGKGTMFEGGVRVPTVVSWPGRVPAGATCAEFASTIDLLPTVAGLLGAQLPAHPIDGHDIRPLLFGEPGAVSPHRAFFGYYAGGQLQTVRDRRFKLHLRHSYRTLNGRAGGSGGRPVPYDQATIGPALFDLQADVAETTDVQHRYPEAFARLTAAAERARVELGDTLTKIEGTARRPAGRLAAGDARLEW